MAFQDPRVISTIQLRERPGTKQEKRRKRLEKLNRKAERKVLRAHSNTEDTRMSA